MSCCFGKVRKKMNDFATFFANILLIFQSTNLIQKKKKKKKINEVALKVLVINDNLFFINI